MVLYMAFCEYCGKPRVLRLYLPVYRVMWTCWMCFWPQVSRAL
jgi:hypothetical protein